MPVEIITYLAGVIIFTGINNLVLDWLDETPWVGEEASNALTSLILRKGWFSVLWRIWSAPARGGSAVFKTSTRWSL
jgi:hypothetical protein